MALEITVTFHEPVTEISATELIKLADFVRDLSSIFVSSNIRDGSIDISRILPTKATVSIKREQLTIAHTGRWSSSVLPAEPTAIVNRWNGPRLCADHECPNTTDDPSGFCPSHRKAAP